MRTVAEIEDDLAEHGTMPTPQEVVELCEMATEGERALQRAKGLEDALSQLGYSVIDVTTDDSNGEMELLIEPIPPPEEVRTA